MRCSQILGWRFVFSAVYWRAARHERNVGVPAGPGSEREPLMDEALLEMELGEQAAEGPGVPVTSKCD